ncbi:hypothetical protein F1737_00035 [Methanoplanus sp. FWC-SCC4]|uniref:4Fe-4S ferredoxin-type domain-containing protein n=1 Tax=Methanochimaera problematica TaxID=2609417 RepID=A0AA97FA39_9EURY|nr:hypothetical protein [Methanoplanus sp. FWC-SCC4]WOF15174.1 hypothetical protein F1737_00035 [Methanoplanus sp. FWC-SCC4]
MTGPDIDEFFKSEEILLFGEVGIEDIQNPDREYAEEFLRGAGSVIVFAKEVPASLYDLPPKEKTKRMLLIAESLDRTAKRLSSLLNKSGIAAKPIPLYLPLTITDGKVRGLIRLKQIAETAGLGERGKSSLLITKPYGPGVFLSGVVTGRHIPKYRHIPEEPAGPVETLCTGCGLCIKNCPGKVFGPDGVDAFSCVTIRRFVPPVFVPPAKWVLKRRLLLRLAAPVAPSFARFATMPCSRCVTVCPRFLKKSER